MNMELTKEKEWTYRKQECARYSVEIDELDFDLEVRIEGPTTQCKSVPMPVSYRSADAVNYDNNRKTWWVGKQAVSAGGDNFATVVNIEEKVDPETDKIAEKYVVSTLQHEGGFEDEIELVFWGSEIDADEGDRVYVSAVGLDSFKGEKYLSVADYAAIQTLDASMTSERISEYCKAAEKAVDDDFEQDGEDDATDENQEGLDAFSPTSVSESD
ncbi:hypothetical protein [Halobacterium noricense]|uniref:hypothetical protein n=1 Tax=Halobacterium noricense TaxID=223182 RepID=UPI001E4D899F|nr:hypothetical protein [Halobacterium noricense]UHH25599.1 hypothetical protein LT974_01345 [Halobacterium noricense]